MPLFMVWSGNLMLAVEGDEREAERGGKRQAVRLVLWRYPSGFLELRERY